jgi:hypothetical protein
MADTEPATETDIETAAEVGAGGTAGISRPARHRRFELGSFPTPGVLPFAVLLWLALFAFMVGLAFAIDRWGTIEHSVWEQGSQPVRWGVLFIGVWIVNTYLAAYVAHGVTRRSFAERTAAFAVLFTLVVAALSALGFLVEGAIYDLRDWPHELSVDHLFDSPDHVPTIFGNYFLLFLVWFAIGVLNAVAFYRNESGWSVVTLPLSVLAAAVAEVGLDGQYPGFVRRAFDGLDDVATPVGLALWATALAAVVALTWHLLRDIPIRPVGS